jgi:hypothetical protein
LNWQEEQDMANDEQLALLLKGVDIWNGWRDDYPDEEINLMGADLRGAELMYANLSQVSLYNANLSNAKLSNANLMGANLFNANLSGADLSNAKLSGGKLYNANLQDALLVGAELLGSNLTAANLTGAWIEKWQINSDTRLDGVVCEYVYLSQDADQKAGRTPRDRNFAPGEFSDRFGIRFNFVALGFTENISWQAVAMALRNLQEQYPTQNQEQGIGIQSIAIEHGLLTINLLVPGELDQVQIEDEFWQGYNQAGQVSKKRSAKSAKSKSLAQDLNGAIDRLVLLAQQA